MAGAFGKATADQTVASLDRAEQARQAAEAKADAADKARQAAGAKLAQQPSTLTDKARAQLRSLPESVHQRRKRNLLLIGCLVLVSVGVWAISEQNTNNNNTQLERVAEKNGFNFKNNMQVFGSKVGESPNSSLADCMGVCANMPACNVFQYSKINASCSFYARSGDFIPNSQYDSGQRK